MLGIFHGHSFIFGSCLKFFVEKNDPTWSSKTRKAVPGCVELEWCRKDSLYCWMVQISGINSPVEGKVVEIPLFMTGFLHARWLFGISAISSISPKVKPIWNPNDLYFLKVNPPKTQSTFQAKQGAQFGFQEDCRKQKKVSAWLLSINFTPKTSHSCLKNATPCFPSDLKIPKSCPTQIYFISTCCQILALQVAAFPIKILEKITTFAWITSVQSRLKLFKHFWSHEGPKEKWTKHPKHLDNLKFLADNTCNIPQKAQFRAISHEAVASLHHLATLHCLLQTCSISGLTDFPPIETPGFAEKLSPRSQLFHHTTWYWP